MKKRYRSEFNTRQNMMKDNYEIYYYSDSHFQSVSPHKHDYYEFYFPAAGKIEMEITGTRTPLSNRSVVIIPPGTIHRAITENSDKSYCRYVFWISKSYFNQLAKDSENFGYIVRLASEQQRFIHHFRENEYPLIQAKVLRLIEEDKSEQYAGNDFVRICIYDLILTLDRLVYERDHPHTEKKQTDLVQQIMEYIEGNLDEDLSLEQLSDHFFVSKYHIAHIFKERTGFGIHQYIQKKRLERCANEIKTGRAVSRVFREYGFTDYSSFYRAFRKEYHLSPSEFQAVYLHDPAFPSANSENG